VRRRRSVDDDVDDDHGDVDLGDVASAMSGVSTMCHLEASLAATRCRAVGEVDEELPHRPGVWILHVDVASRSRCSTKMLTVSML
jgi:hypothetical protein